MTVGKDFVNLHTHSYYSILESSASPERILQKAKSFGCPAVALTDNGAGYGLIDFYEQSERIGDIQPLLGVELYISMDSRFEQRPNIDGHEGNIVLLAQNKTGYENLLKLISIAHLEGFFRKPRIDFEVLSQYNEGLIVLTGSTVGNVGKLLERFGEERAESFFVQLKDIFQDRLYGEIVARSFDVQKKLNKFIIQLSQKHSVKLVITSDARFIEPSEEEATDTLYCIGQNLKVNDPNRFRFAEKNYFLSFEEMCAVCSEYIDADTLEQARVNALDITQSITLQLEFDRDLLPSFSVSKGETESSQLRKLCEEAIKKRYGTSNEIVEKRLHYELSVIGKMGFDAYFLIVADFIHFAKRNGIAVGPGRGSAAGSIVAYLLEITNIDPIGYELLFERFLNPERISMPDIDIDFSDERRDEVLHYVIEKYGAEKVSKVCTFGTLSAKAALKDVGRAQGVPFADMNACTKLLPNKPGFSLKDALEISEFKKLLETNANIQKVYDIASTLEGCIRHVSVHACAVIIGKEDLTQYVPIQHAPTSDQLKITQFPYQQLEHLGLLKMDFLGLKNLSVIEKTLQHIKNIHGIDLDLNAIPLDDTKTFEMLSQGHTTGVFQFESAGMRRYLKELVPTELEDLVAMNALYRPGPMEYIPMYIKGKHDPKSVKYFDPTLEPILKKTYGIAVYQEQIMKIAQEFAGFSLGQADILRKAIGKKKMDLLAEQRMRFIDGAVEQGHEKEKAVKLFDDIVVPFSGYGFNRSHAVCYARIAYETAYLRANYPVCFMAAMMTTDRSNTDRIVLEMNECHSMGIDVLPPSVNESGSHFTVVKRDLGNQDSSLLVVEEEKKSSYPYQIRFGLTAIKGMGEETANQIIFERNRNGKFTSLQDFAKRVPQKLINKKTLEALAFSGAFDMFADRKAIVDSLEDLARFAKEHQDKSGAGQMGLFGGIGEESIDFVLKDTVATKEDILRWERESLGLFVSDHPLKGLNDYFQKYGRLIGSLTSEEDEGNQVTLHGLVVAARKITTRKGANMGIVTLEDTSGKIEIAVFPKVYEGVSQKVFEVDAFVRVRGKVNERDSMLNIIADEIKIGDIHAVGEWQDNENELKEKRQYTIHIPADTLKTTIGELKRYLQSHAVLDGGLPVLIHFQGQVIRLPFLVESNSDIERSLERILKG